MRLLLYGYRSSTCITKIIFTSLKAGYYFCIKITDVGVSFWHVCVLSCVGLFAAPWTIAHQIPLSMEFSRQEGYWSGLPFPPPGDLPNPGIEPASLTSPALAGGFFTTASPENSYFWVYYGLPWWLEWWRICLQYRRPGFDPWVRKIPWRREWQPIPVFLLGEFHGQRNLVSYNPQGGKELDTTDRLTLSSFLIV